MSAVLPRTAALPGPHWWLSAPALVLFGCLLLVPLALTAVLSFNAFDAATGVKAGEFTLAHYAKVIGDEYYLGIFWRTFWISALTSFDDGRAADPNEVSQRIASSSVIEPDKPRLISALVRMIVVVSPG